MVRRGSTVRVRQRALQKRRKAALFLSRRFGGRHERIDRPTRRGRRRVRRRQGALLAEPIYGRERVAKLMVGTLTQVERLGGSVGTTELNGQPGVKFVDEEGRIAAAMSLEIADGVVQTIRGITNPDKLVHLGPVADLRAILRGGRTTE